MNSIFFSYSVSAIWAKKEKNHKKLRRLINLAKKVPRYFKKLSLSAKIAPQIYFRKVCTPLFFLSYLECLSEVKRRQEFFAVSQQSILFFAPPTFTFPKSLRAAEAERGENLMSLGEGRRGARQRLEGK